MIHPACFSAVLDLESPASGLPASWAVLTAFARTGTVRHFADDLRADAALAVELDGAGVRRWRVTGRSVSGDHAEPGWGCDLPLASALELGRRFDQVAIFWVDSGDLWVGDCRGERATGVKVGPLAPKVNAPVPGLGGDSRFLRFAGEDVVRRAALLRFLGPEGDRAPHFAELLNEADDSDYAPGDWCAAAAEFQNLLEVSGRSSPFAHKLGYLSCCASACANIPPALRPPLRESLAAMWEEYGYAG